MPKKPDGSAPSRIAVFAVSGASGNANTSPAAEVPWQDVEVADHAVAALRLVKQATATLRGIVRENGLPLADARVTFREHRRGLRK